MINGLLFLFTLCIISCIKFEELPKYDTIKAIPDTRVYLDISSFEVGRSIYIEFTMDLFFSKLPKKDSYTLKIGQVPSKYYDDYICWSNLPTITIRNISNPRYSPYLYTYSWVDIKKPGMKYLYILPPEPYEKFYTFWNNKITIKSIGGKSDRQIRNEILNIVIPILFVLTVVSFMIFIFYKIIKDNKNHKNFPPASTILELPIVNDPNCPPPSQFIQEPINDNNAEYPKPISPMGNPEQLNN